MCMYQLLLVFVTILQKVIGSISIRKVLHTYSSSLLLLDMSYSFCFFTPLSGVIFLSSDELEESIKSSVLAELVFFLKVFFVGFFLHNIIIHNLSFLLSNKF
jgi:hypothetical protein